jgi:hypothetical protein
MTLQVHPTSALRVAGSPPMAGRLLRDEAEFCFVPAFGFEAATGYIVSIDGEAIAELTRPAAPRPPRTTVQAIYPSAPVLPRNLLRCYVWFSGPMAEGYAGSQVRLLDAAGHPIASALLTSEYELWDSQRRRLTVLFDPGRIKRGLAGNQELGYPLRAGAWIRLVVDAGFRDVTGTRLRRGAGRTFRVGMDLRGRIDPARWRLRLPDTGSRGPLRVEFDRTLDHGLLGRCLRVIGPDGRPIASRASVGDGERSWRLEPLVAWAPGEHHLVVNPVLEDIAGNSLHRTFDRDLACPGDEPDPMPATALKFRPA